MEMMVLVIIVGIIASLAVPDFLRTMQKVKLNSATRDIVSDLRWARSHSIATRTQVGLNFDFTKKSYKVFLDIDNPGSYQFDAAKDSVVKAGDLSPVGSANCTFANNTVIFNPNGTCSSSGQITCYSTDNNDSKTIDVLASTGRIKITS